MSLVIFPTAHVRAPVRVVPGPLSESQSIQPVPSVRFAVGVRECALIGENQTDRDGMSVDVSTRQFDISDSHKSSNLHIDLDQHRISSLAAVVLQRHGTRRTIRASLLARMVGLTFRSHNHCTTWSAALTFPLFLPLLS